MAPAEYLSGPGEATGSGPLKVAGGAAREGCGAARPLPLPQDPLLLRQSLQAIAALLEKLQLDPETLPQDLLGSSPRLWKEAWLLAGLQRLEALLLRHASFVRMTLSRLTRDESVAPQSCSVLPQWRRKESRRRKVLSLERFMMLQYAVVVQQFKLLLQIAALCRGFVLSFAAIHGDIKTVLSKLAA